MSSPINRLQNFITAKKQLLVKLGLATLIISLVPILLNQTQPQATVPNGFQSLQPLKSQSRTAINIIDQLHYTHYQNQKIDDRLSKIIFNKLIDSLDPSKNYFLQQDIDELQEQYQIVLDDTLKKGVLTPGFAIFNRFQQRFIDRLSKNIKFLETYTITTDDFETDQELPLNENQTSWAKNNKVLDELWRKQIINAALNLQLTGKPTAENQTLLLKRFRNRLNRALQINSEDAFQTYMNALTQSFDPHTQYFTPRNSENFHINMRLSLEGIGAVLQSEDEYTQVVRLVAGGPAEKSKLLHPADRIVAVGQSDDNSDLVDIIGWRIDEVVELIRGPKGTVVRLEIIPHDATHNETKIITLVRDTVKLEEQAVQHKMLNIERQGRNYTFGVLHIPTFYVDFKGMHQRNENYRSTSKDVAQILPEFKNKKVNGLIVDLRNNGGGSLQEANQLLGLFIRSGPTSQIRDNHGQIEVLLDNDESIAYNGPIIVLINRLSASASEIFAGAIQDYQRGIIVGSQSFGKGTVQALKTLNQGQLKITQAKFYRISGASNQHKGVIPDILFPNMYDTENIGESALNNALPWDTIKPIAYESMGSIQSVLLQLQTWHQGRISQNPDFQFLKSQLALLSSWNNLDKISLNVEMRRQEKEAREKQLLTLENKRRASKDLPLLTRWNDDKNLPTGNPVYNDQSNATDIYLTESAHVLADYIALSNKANSATTP